VLHGDNGATLKATTVLAMLNWLGVKPSYSRPRVSEDNAYAEGVAVPHGQVPPGVPGQGLRRSQRGTRLGDRLRALVQRRPSTQRHAGDDLALLAARHALYTEARALNPARWSRNTRNWSPVRVVTLNPERDSIIKTHLEGIENQPLAA
jgi:putative transposase